MSHPSTSESALDFLSQDTLFSAVSKKKSGRSVSLPRTSEKYGTKFLGALHAEGLVAVCDRTDWNVNRDTTHRLGLFGRWDPVLAYIAYGLSHFNNHQGPFTALNLGPGDVKLLEELSKRRRTIREVLAELNTHLSPDATHITLDDSESFLDETLENLWEHYGLGNKIYMEITNILATMIPTPKHANEETKNQFKELRRYLGLSILYRAQQPDTPIGKKCQKALETKTGIFDIILHPQNYGFTNLLTSLPVPGEYDTERNESPSQDLQTIWNLYFSDPIQFLQKYGISLDTPGLHTILTHSASHHGLILGQFETTNLPIACADLIVSIRGDSHLSDDEFVRMLERTTFQALREHGVYFSDGVVGSYDRFEAMRILGFIRAAHQIGNTRQNIFQTGLVMRNHPRNSARRMVQSAFASPKPSNSWQWNFAPLLEQGTDIIDPVKYVKSVDYLVRLVLERIILQKAKQRSIGTREVTRRNNDTIDSRHTTLVQKIIAAHSEITDTLAHAELPLEDLTVFFDLNNDTHRANPLRQLVESLMEDFAANREQLLL